MNGLASSALTLGAISGFLAVAMGAFGAHAIRARVPAAMLEIWKTASEYHFYHALALVLVGVLARQSRAPWLDLSAACFLGGTVIFCGSLYLLALTETRWLGAITPIGGLLFLAGWAALAWSATRN